MYYFNDSLYIYAIAIGSLYNNLYIHRIDKIKNEVKEIAVPLVYSGKQHWYLKQFKSIPDDKNIDVVFPQISYNLENIEPDNERQNNKFETIGFNGDIDYEIRQWLQTSVPYKFNYSLNLYSKYYTDLNQMLEQILPFFPAGARDLHINEIPFLNIYRSARVTLTSLSEKIEVEYDEKGDRKINFTIGLSLDGYIYQPIKNEKIISKINMGIYTKMINNEYLLDAIIDKDGIVPDGITVIDREE